MKRIALMALFAFAAFAKEQPKPFSVVEASIPDMQAALKAGRVTSRELVMQYLLRIAMYEDRLNGVMTVNRNALAEAEALDRERASRGSRGPLHGIPIILKDNYDMRGMPTSAGTLALATAFPADDAFQVRKLREAGAVILGKSNMHELASGITTIASYGGQTLNPYDLTRNPGGSSGGTGAAIAASYAAVGWGSDTCGSIRIPASHNNLVGLRPTKGLSSIDGIIPLSHTQDVGGPLARTMRDLAIALDATVGFDPADEATLVMRGRANPSFVDALDEFRSEITSRLSGAERREYASRASGRANNAAINPRPAPSAEAMGLKFEELPDEEGGALRLARELRRPRVVPDLPDLPCPFG